MKERRFLDERRWLCISRPQYMRSCGISSLVSVWNYLFTTLGTGTLPPISQEQALTIVNAVSPDEKRYFGDIDFGVIQKNGAILQWFKLLLYHFKQKGTSYYFY